MYCDRVSMTGFLIKITDATYVSSESDEAIPVT